jgi:hypothetical protein
MSTGGLRDHGFGPAAETWTNSPSDCGAIADRSRTAMADEESFGGGLAAA